MVSQVNIYVKSGLCTLQHWICQQTLICLWKPSCPPHGLPPDGCYVGVESLGVGFLRPIQYVTVHTSTISMSFCIQISHTTRLPSDAALADGLSASAACLILKAALCLLAALSSSGIVTYRAFACDKAVVEGSLVLWFAYNSCQQPTTVYPWTCVALPSTATGCLEI